MFKVRGQSEESRIKGFGSFLRTDKLETQGESMFQFEFESWKKQSDRRKTPSPWER